MVVVYGLAVVAALYAAFHIGHVHANIRHGLARGRYGFNLFWTCLMGPYMNVPGPFAGRLRAHSGDKL